MAGGWLDEQLAHEWITAAEEEDGVGLQEGKEVSEEADDADGQHGEEGEGENDPASDHSCACTGAGGVKGRPQAEA